MLASRRDVVDEPQCQVSRLVPAQRRSTQTTPEAGAIASHQLDFAIEGQAVSEGSRQLLAKTVVGDIGDHHAACRLARQAISNMPRWPSTPTGKPLMFEKTFSFSPFASDGPPLYKDDCLPDPPVFSNPFAWDGKSARAQAQAEPIEKADPQVLEDCLKQLPQDSIEAESARDKRLMDQWGTSKTGK